MKKYILLATVIGIIACGKDKITDSEAPVITITSPTSGEMVMVGDSVSLDITVTDVDLHEVTLGVANAADTSIHYFADGVHSHDTNLHYTQKFVAPSVPSHTNVILTVHAEDHNSH